jgi:MFS family permease
VPWLDSFFFFGYIVSHFSLDTKQGFYYSFISYALGLLLISHISTAATAYLSLFVYGMGVGFFWLTIHTYELTETKDHERDFYSSLLQSGGLIISIVAPLVASVLIWASVYVFHASSFALLFIVAPFFYLLGLFCFKGIQEYRPERIELADVKHFLFEKRNRLAQLYLAPGGSHHILGQTLIPLAVYFVLKNELSVGVYSTIAGLLSVVVILFLSRHRNQGNRIFLFGILAFGVALATFYLGYSLTFFALVIFTIVEAVLFPIMQVSDHVISLQTMETIGMSKKDFYATMILRDFSLWFWRMVVGFIVLGVCQVILTPQGRLTFGLSVTAVVIVCVFLGAKLLVSKMGVKTVH